MSVAFSRRFSMPSAATFSVTPIADFVSRFARPGLVSVDPFARNASLATYTNDIDTGTSADFHLEATAFLSLLKERGVVADVGIFDPPYSPRQISEAYKAAGKAVGMEETQNARLYKSARDALDQIMAPGGFVLSFGWNSAGMGVKRGYDLIEIMLVPHGGAHNDTICLAERKRMTSLPEGMDLTLSLAEEGKEP